MNKSIYSTKYSKLARRLVKARNEAGLTQIEVASKINKPQSFVSKIESGERRLDVVELENLSKLYKKKIEWFLN